MGLLIEAGLVHGQTIEDKNGDIAATITRPGSHGMGTNSSTPLVTTPFGAI